MGAVATQLRFGVPVAPWRVGGKVMLTPRNTATDRDLLPANLPANYPPIGGKLARPLHALHSGCALRRGAGDNVPAPAR